MKKLSPRGLYLVLIAAAALLPLSFITILWLVPSSPAVRLPLLIIPLGMLVLVFVSWHIFRKMITDFVNEMDECLEKMIRGEDDLVFSFTEETLTAKLQIKLKRLYEILQSHARHSREEKEALQSLVSDISHQVKIPIANIKMTGDILRDREVSPKQQRDFLREMALQTDKLDFLMQTMIKISRLEVGMLTIQAKNQPVFDTLAGALSSIQLSAESKNIHVLVNCDEELQVCHDKRWTGEALFNILDNAVKYTPTGGSIDICVTRMEVYTRISITDTGRGITEKNFGDIFKRFYRAPEVHDIDGAGIGLYLTRQIITMQGGYIKVESKLGQGTRFSVFLPNPLKAVTIL